MADDQQQIVSFSPSANTWNYIIYSPPASNKTLQNHFFFKDGMLWPFLNPVAIFCLEKLIFIVMLKNVFLLCIQESTEYLQYLHKLDTERVGIKMTYDCEHWQAVDVMYRKIFVGSWLSYLSSHHCFMYLFLHTLGLIDQFSSKFVCKCFHRNKNNFSRSL